MLNPKGWDRESSPRRKRHPKLVVRPLYDLVGLAIRVEVRILRLSGLERSSVLDPLSGRTQPHDVLPVTEQDRWKRGPPCNRAGNVYGRILAKLLRADEKRSGGRPI